MPEISYCVPREPVLPSLSQTKTQTTEESPACWEFSEEKKTNIQIFKKKIREKRKKIERYVKLKLNSKFTDVVVYQHYSHTDKHTNRQTNNTSLHTRTTFYEIEHPEHARIN